MSDDKHKPFADFEDPGRCSWCREPISDLDQKNGMVLHIKVAPLKALHPETGEVMGFLQPEGPKNRYLHGRPCGEVYARAKLVCELCNYWCFAKRGAGLCLCRCHPPIKDNKCRYQENDLERSSGQ